jgi:hypothetical protein
MESVGRAVRPSLLCLKLGLKHRIHCVHISTIHTLPSILMGASSYSESLAKKITITEEKLAIKIIGDPRNFTGFNIIGTVHLRDPSEVL